MTSEQRRMRHRLLHQPCLSVERHRPRLPRRRQETRDPEGARRHGHARVRLPDCAGGWRDFRTFPRRKKK